MKAKQAGGGLGSQDKSLCKDGFEVQTLASTEDIHMLKQHMQADEQCKRRF